MVSANPNSAPKLSFTPLNLDFGEIYFSTQGDSSPSTTLTITNAGQGILAGRINPQMSWAKVVPPNFSCAGGQSSSHQVSLTTQAPHSWKNKQYHYDFLILINSNGGSGFIGGKYTTPEGLSSQKPTTSWIWIGVPAIAIILIFSLIIFLIVQLIPSNIKPTSQPSILFTQGAETVVARLTLTSASHPPTIPTYLPSIFIPSEQVATLSATPLFTPWPRNDFPNPEQFIKDYYWELNNHNYERAWALLSKNFQQSCCSIGGNDPYQVYKNWWETIVYVDVISAYLQQWDKNPAEVYVALRYHNIKGQAFQTFNTFELITDPIRKNLLIDRVK
jgi:hypothetical protein